MEWGKKLGWAKSSLVTVQITSLVNELFLDNVLEFSKIISHEQPICLAARTLRYKMSDFQGTDYRGCERKIAKTLLKSKSIIRGSVQVTQSA